MKPWERVQVFCGLIEALLPTSCLNLQILCRLSRWPKGLGGCWYLSCCPSQSTSVYLIEKSVRLDYKKLLSVGSRSLLGKIGALLYHFWVDTFEKIPPKDTYQMSKPKTEIRQKAFSLLFLFDEQIMCLISIGILVFFFNLRVPVLRFHKHA